MQNLLKLSYWFEQLPTPFQPAMYKTLLVIFGALVVLGIVEHLIARKKKDNLYWREGVARIAAAMFQAGVVGLLLAWITQQQIQFFGMRFWFLVLAVWFVLRIVFIVRHMLKKIPAKMSEQAERERIRKYLP